jgi:hypothetical protein
MRQTGNIILVAISVFIGTITFGPGMVCAKGNDLDFTLSREPEGEERLLGEEDFVTFTREFAVIFGTPSFSNYSPLGWTGLDFAASLAVADVPQRYSHWSNTTSDGHAPEVYWLGRANARLGLPNSFDVGVFYSQVFNSSPKGLGADLRWSAIDGSYFSPAVGLRIGVQKITGVEGLDMSMLLFEGGFSKEFPDFSLKFGLMGIYFIATPEDIPLKTEEDPTGAEHSQREFSDLIPKGIFGFSHRLYGDFWLDVNAEVGRISALALAVKLFLPSE